MVKTPLLMTEGWRVLEKTARRRPENPLAGMRATLLAGSFLVTGGIVMAQGGPGPVWAGCFLIAVVLGFRRGREPAAIEHA